MSDIEKAISVLENKQRIMTHEREHYSIDEIESNGLAILALEKQVAKKPIDTPQMWQCPNCKSHIFHEQQLMHCRQCGQLVSWGR